MATKAETRNDAPAAGEKGRPTAWPWPNFHHRRAQRDAAVAAHVASGQVLAEDLPEEFRDEDREAELVRKASLARAGDRLISPAPPLFDPTNPDEVRARDSADEPVYDEGIGAAGSAGRSQKEDKDGKDGKDSAGDPAE